MRRLLICLLLTLLFLPVCAFSQGGVASDTTDSSAIASGTVDADDLDLASGSDFEAPGDLVELDEVGSESADVSDSAGETFNAPVTASPALIAPAAFVPTVSLPDPVQGDGDLAVTIESFAGGNPKRISQLAERVELWLGDKRLASLNSDEPEVVQENKRRLFIFPKITLPHGYYFITVRCYGSAALYGRRKWHGETFQVGIHPGKPSRVFKKITFFHW